MSSEPNIEAGSPIRDMNFGPHEAISTTIFAIALPVAAYITATYLDNAPAGVAAILLVVAATGLSGAYVYGRIESLAREMNEAAAATLRLPRIGDKIPAAGPRAWVSSREPGRRLSAAITTAAFQIEQRIDALEARTARDVETGLLNRDGLRIEIMAEINRARRSDQPLTLGMIDIDDFGAFVSERGMITAGAAANTAARIIGGQLRNYDRIARRDGSSFLLLMPGVGKETATDILRRVRDEIECALALPNGASAGLASLDRSDVGADPVLVECPR